MRSLYLKKKVMSKASLGGMVTFPAGVMSTAYCASCCAACTKDAWQVTLLLLQTCHTHMYHITTPDRYRTNAVNLVNHGTVTHHKN